MGKGGPLREKQVPFGFAQGRLSCLAWLARRNDKREGRLRSDPAGPFVRRVTPSPGSDDARFAKGREGWG